MSIAILAAWSVILGLAMMSIGGLVLWAYGARRARIDFSAAGPEADATQNFHMKLVRWFFIYGVLVIALGAALLFWGGSILF
ncbi:MAG: hypothetical protein WAO98_10860 [Alphaproteobacteria bacterium]